MKKINILILCVAFVFASCKYEEGPAISLSTKKDRVANTWNVYEATNDGEDVTDSYDQFTLMTAEDGDASLVATYTFGDITYQYETDGTWEFDNNKENLVLDFEDDDADRTYMILRLTEDEMWLREKGEDLELKLN
ncbi:lipocalin family protein [bacterium]|nr:lipocalin family protein [bacterium]